MPANLEDKLQSVMNASARIVCGLKQYDHITSHMLDSLYWLRVPQRVTFKRCLLVYKSLLGCAPNYLTELCNLVARSEPRRCLLSAADGDLIIPRTTTSFGNRAFAHAGPHAWNSLPLFIRAAKTLPMFQKLLKTHLFEQSYGQSKLLIFQLDLLNSFFYHLHCKSLLWQFFLPEAISKSSFWIELNFWWHF